MDGYLGTEIKREEVIDTKPVVSPKNKLNDLTAPEWINRTVSVFVQKGHGKNSSEARFEREHPAPFSYNDITRFIDMFTKRGEVVLDPFSGIGSTLKASAVTGRRGIGIELNSRFVDLTRQRLAAELLPLGFDGCEQRVLLGDARTILPTLACESVAFSVTSPPYWGILNKIDHKARQERLAAGRDHNYGEDAADLAHVERYEDFLGELGGVFDATARVLQPKRYLVVIVGDFRHKERYYMFHSDLAAELERRGNFGLRGITIIHQKFKRVFPYGYPHSFVPNIHHQYAMVFQRTSGAGNAG